MSSILNRITQIAEMDKYKAGRMMIAGLMRGCLSEFKQGYEARAEDDFAHMPNGSFLFHKDGSVMTKMWTDEDVPVVVTIHYNRVKVEVTEDQWAETERPSDDNVVLDSAAIYYDGNGHYRYAGRQIKPGELGDQ